MAKKDFLKKRAKEFLENADFNIKEEQYSLAAFNLEQAAQLYLKYYLFLKNRSYPKTHSLKRLLSGVGEAYDQQQKVEQMKKENINLISDLEQSYITSRYLPAEFTREQTENMRAWVKNLIDLLREL